MIILILLLSDLNHEQQQLSKQMQERFLKIFDNMTRQVSLQHFETYILHSSQHQNQLFNNIRQCKTHGYPRFNIWRMLLEVIPVQGNWDDKKQAIEKSRNRWKQHRQQSKTGFVPKKVAATQSTIPKNPLMKVMAKPQKKQPESDSFLNEQIKKDVDRTYQEMSFFQQSQILKLLSNVLFVWCKINPDISYRQGMNELLASIVYVYFKEAVPSNFEASNEIQQKYLYLNSIAYAEPDIYAVFDRIMQIQKDMYKQNLDNDVKDLMNPNTKNNTPILQRILQIQDQKLKSIDLQLFRILKLQDVKTKTFLLRWIRCMHTRQFGLVNSLYIWDSIFLDALQSPNSKNRKQYEFIDAMCLAMFIYMRAIVLTRQTANEILQIYQKYPQLEGQYLFQLVKLAWSVCQQLRNLAANPTSNSNWYQDSQKLKKLGLMEKGSPQFVKQAEEKKKRQPSSPFVITEHEKFVEKKSPTREEKTNHHQNGTPKIDKESVVQPTPPSKEKKVEQIPTKSPERNQESTSKEEDPIEFDPKQVRSLIQTLKQSISLNEDIQSRVLANKVLKALEIKLKK